MPAYLHGPQTVAALKVAALTQSLRVRWVLAVAAPLLGILCLSGCQNNFEYSRYPKDLEYPVRTDLMLKPGGAMPKGPEAEPFYPPGPGRLDEEMVQFKKLGGETIDPNDAKIASVEQRKQLQAALKHYFGTPRLPQVGDATGEDDAVVTQLTALKVRDAEGAAPFKTLAQGSKVFRFHCVHCHGLTGDGRGPTGPWVVPHPRDYRPGLFKFISSKPESPRKPRRDDLTRVLHNGIENTSMPSFALLDVRDPESKDTDPTDLEAVASYVMHLSIRGTVEIRVFAALSNGEDFKMDDKVHELMTQVVSEWSNSSSPLAPTEGRYFEFKIEDYHNNAKELEEAKANSIRNGYRLFSDSKGKASCIGCHLDYGRQVNFRYDKWGTMVRPMNLTSGVYRGGRRPIDLYWRIKGGIDPSGMPAAEALNNEKDVWDVVNFVHNLPYPSMLPEDVRNKVYDRPPDDGKAEK